MSSNEMTVHECLQSMKTLPISQCVKSAPPKLVQPIIGEVVQTAVERMKRSASRVQMECQQMFARRCLKYFWSLCTVLGKGHWAESH